MNKTATSTLAQPVSHATRVGWVDIVKGMSIFLVVMMHSTLGVQNAVGETSWMGAIVEFARPFRIPCFMLVSGLFLHKTINGDWPRFLDRKILHFAYFYILWVALQVIVKTPAWMGEGQSAGEILTTYITTFVQPFGTLWFIYLLPVFYLVTRLLRNTDWRIVLAGALLLQILPIHTGSTLIDEFASRYIYFFIGYLFYARFFDWAQYATKYPLKILALLATWIAVNLYLVLTPMADFLTMLAVPTGAGSILKLADLPLVSLALALAGTLAMIAVGALILQIKWLSFMRWVGEHSIVIYLAFFLPMGISRVVLLKFGSEYLSTGTIAAIVTLSAALGPIVFYWLVKLTGWGKFLFERPEFARLKDKTNTRPASVQPAE